MMRRLLLAVVLLAVLAAAGAGAAAWWVHERALPLAEPVVDASIEPGDSPRVVAQRWVDAGVQVPAWALYEWFRWSGQARRIRAGSYELQRGDTAATLLNRMVRGDETLATVRLIEGWTMRQFRAELARAEGLKPVAAQMDDAALMTALGSPGLPAEGWFFPDTYAYNKMMKRQLDAAWAARAPDLPLKSPAEALTLASIVEKETGIEADRSQVAGVFANRLRIGMLLQTDPTVIYGLGTAFDGNLRRRDLTTDGPFNTYTRAGLPPTPIAMPGRASLLAAVRPAQTRALYFVARGDGSSVFSETLAEHNRAVDRYQRGR